MAGERGQPGRDDMINDAWWRKGKECFARRRCMGGYESLQDSCSVHTSGDALRRPKEQDL